MKYIYNTSQPFPADTGDGELEVDELVENIDVLNWHCFHGKDLMREFTRIDTDGDGVIRCVVGFGQTPEILNEIILKKIKSKGNSSK